MIPIDSIMPGVRGAGSFITCVARPKLTALIGEPQTPEVEPEYLEFDLGDGDESEDLEVEGLEPGELRSMIGRAIMQNTGRLPD